MAKKKKETEPLYNGLFEIDNLESYLKDCADHEIQVDTDLALLLCRAIQEKLRYFEEKYDFQLDQEDQFFIEDYNNFMRKREAWRVGYQVEREKQWQGIRKKTNLEVIGKLKKEIEILKAEVQKGENHAKPKV